MFLNNGIVQYLPVSCRPDIVLREGLATSNILEFLISTLPRRTLEETPHEAGAASLDKLMSENSLRVCVFAPSPSQKPSRASKASNLSPDEARMPRSTPRLLVQLRNPQSPKPQTPHHPALWD